ncbi:MAG: Mu-like prophage major head subunit gpT family protein [Deltaproteobacteria bacterium]|nr:Mu-like prophage major head subunit gpT family protein [Deltaproteobacteria bacterium]MBW2031966.1 Mu-like prophage major head subunit gpT family protein [Deltaproteobacteria bacterium]
MGVNKWYGLAYSEYPTEFTEIFDEEQSQLAFEEDVGISSFGLAQEKPEGRGTAYDDARQGFIDRYVHGTYSLGFIITREMWEDGIAGTVALKRARALAFSIRQTKEILGANILNRAFNSDYVFGDGVEMISTLHPNVAGGVWSNELETPADLSEAALEQACIDIANFTNDRGLRIAVRPMKLVVAVDNTFESTRILRSELRVTSADNDINAIRALGMIPEVVINHYLTDQDSWYIKTDCPDGLKYFNRRSDEFDTDNDFDTENARFKSTFRASWGASDKRGIYGSAGA